MVRTGTALLFALIAGAGTSSQWNEWLLFRNAVDFGDQTDPLFNQDVGFYVFKLPFLSYVVGWLFAALVIVLIITAVAHYLNGGIRLQAPGPNRVTPQVKVHLSVLLGLLALVKAAGYWLQQYELTVSTRGTVDGATYTDVNAQLPAIQLLMFVAVAAFVLFVINIRRKGWVLPVLGIGIWAIVAVDRRRDRSRRRAAIPGPALGAVARARVHRRQHRRRPGRRSGWPRSTTSRSTPTPTSPPRTSPPRPRPRSTTSACGTRRRRRPGAPSCRSRPSETSTPSATSTWTATSSTAH